MKDKDEIKDNELYNVNGGTVNDGVELVIPEKLKVIDNPAFPIIDPVPLKPDSKKIEEEKNYFVPNPY